MQHTTKHTARDRQVGGDHYLRNGIQVWDIIDAFELGYLEGCVLKYLLRSKPGVDRREDLLKLIHCAERLLERTQEQAHD